MAYDAAGNLTTDDQGQRTRKVTPSGTTVYHYDLAGNLISETNGTGAPIRDYAWQDATPLAQIEAGTPERLIFLHTDHLATPRLATNATGNALWRWEGEAFGNTPPSEDIDGDGQATVINLRFPGQYFDAETGRHYNWNRYYDAAIGRYVRSDPIGLVGGINSYLYGEDNALRFNDPTGLFFGIPGLLEKGGGGITGAIPILGGLGVGVGIDLFTARTCCGTDGKKYVEIFSGFTLGVSGGVAVRLSGGRSATVNVVTLGNTKLSTCLRGFTLKGLDEISVSGTAGNLTLNLEGKAGGSLDIGLSPAAGGAIILNLFGGEFPLRRVGPFGDCCNQS